MRRFLFACTVTFFLASASEAGSVVTARTAALSTVSPYATRIGLEVLRSGGTAADAAVAVSFALAVAHPQAGNLGGGGFFVYYDAKTRDVWTLDYREVAPLAAKREMYLGPEGNPIPQASTVGALSAGVPGSVAGLAEAHKKFGRMNWRGLLVPAVRLAREGFRTDRFLTEDLAEAQTKRQIDRFPSTAALYYPSGKPLEPGSLLRQPQLAETIDRIARFGAADFYEGTTASQIVQSMRANGGIISERDLHEYRPIWRAPIRIDWGEYQIYTMSPPSAGGIILAQALGILTSYDLARYGFQSPRSLHLIAEAERRAYIDRNRTIGDPAAVRIPYRELLSAERAGQWRGSILLDRATTTNVLTVPGAVEKEQTTHFSIVDSYGNIAAVTTTLNDTLGGGLVVDGAGFLLNNEMDDFTTAPGKPNAYGLIQGESNAIQPGRKMASSMTPTIIFRGGKPWLVLGTRGGATIPTSVLQVFLNVVVYRKSLAEAIAAPRFHHQSVPDQIYYERDRVDRALLDQLIEMGHSVQERGSIGDINALEIRNGTIVAVADPRAGGAAGGY